MLGNVQLFSKSHDAHLYSFFYIYGRNKKVVGTGGVIKNKKRIHRTMRCSETKKNLEKSDRECSEWRNKRNGKGRERRWFSKNKQGPTTNKEGAVKEN